jgi:arginase
MGERGKGGNAMQAITGRSLALIGAPTDLGASVRGASLAPAALRLAGLAAALADLGHEVVDCGDILDEPVTGIRGLLPDLGGPAHRLDALSDYARSIARATSAALEAEATPVLLGGDHAVAMGSLSAAAARAKRLRRPLHVLWVDTHADFNTLKTSPSGNPHGMALALACGHPDFAQFADKDWFEPVDPGRVTIFGARSIDRDERGLLRERGVEIVDMRRLDEEGVALPLARVLDRVAKAKAMLHVSFDLDVIDPAVAPGVGTPVLGGLSYREAHLVMELLHDSGAVSSLDMVELNPLLDQAGATARLAIDLLASLFGRRIVERR